MRIINANQVVYIDSGHSTGDPGAVVGEYTEARENMFVRDECVVLLKEAGFDVRSVPDNLNLRKSIDWVNQYAKDINDGIALAIHFNYAANPDIHGVEVYHYKYDQTSINVANALAQSISDKTGIKNRGAKSDETTRFGRLGWVRETNCWATLVEVQFLGNVDGMEAIRAPGGYKRVAEGIVSGLLKVYGLDPTEHTEEPPEPPESVEPEKVEESKEDTFTAIELQLKKLWEWIRRIQADAKGRQA